MTKLTGESTEAAAVLPVATRRDEECFHLQLSQPLTDLASVSCLKRWLGILPRINSRQLLLISPREHTCMLGSEINAINACFGVFLQKPLLIDTVAPYLLVSLFILYYCLLISTFRNAKNDVLHLHTNVSVYGSSSQSIQNF